MTKKPAQKPSQAQSLRDYFTKYPNKTTSEVAKAMGVSYQIAYMAKSTMEKKAAELAETIRNRFPEPAPKVTIVEEMPVTMHESEADSVNHPAHYKVGGIETIDFIEAKKLNYNMGNALKYIARADYKGNRKQDLEKAIWYLQRELTHAT
jgi:hypothetical protein